MHTSYLDCLGCACCMFCAVCPSVLPCRFLVGRGSESNREHLASVPRAFKLS